ncbi:Cytochrome c oxidase assembly protein [Trichinella spiralis]|uniref:Cytochrome c oxidase assembly protein COX16 homolog, mitochondrial n=2 Tax=Trichinella TaxID=6333 RepID=A0ABR3K7E4_TRISP
MQRNHHFIRYGVPFIGFVVCGSLGLQFFTSIRLEYRKVFASRKLFTSLGVDPSKQKSLEQIYEEDIAGKKFDDWKNIRAPRPEESNFEFKEAISERQKNAKNS